MPSNDHFADAEPLEFGAAGTDSEFYHAMHSVGAASSLEPGEPAPPTGRDRSTWFVVQVPATEPVAVFHDAERTSVDVFTGTDVASLTRIGGQDGGVGYQSFEWTAAPLVSYYVRLTSTADEEYPTLFLARRPAADSFAAAHVIDGDGSGTYSVLSMHFASLEATEPATAPMTTSSLWYRLSVTRPRRVDVSFSTEQGPGQ